MIDYLNLTAARFWDIFAAGVPDWTTQVKAGNSLKRLLSDDRAKYKAMIARSVADFPQLDIAPVQLAIGGFSPQVGATTTFCTAGGLATDSAILTADTVAWELRITSALDDYGAIGTLWPLLLAALVRSGAKLSLKPWDAASGPLSGVKTWAGVSGSIRPETLNDSPVLVARPQILVTYQFNASNVS